MYKLSTIKEIFGLFIKKRKFFATKAERKLDVQVSGALLGHSPYMKTYYEYEVS